MLRSETQGRLLARILADPAKEYNLTELVEWTGSSMPTVSREVDRAEQAGIVTSRKVGPTRLVRANPDHPLYPAVRQLILGTYGPPAVIAETFADLAGAEAVVLFGSWAARFLGRPGRAPNDIDVLVIGEVDLDAMHDAADAAEHQIGLPVQVTARTRQAWLDADESFIREVRSRPIVPVLVDDRAATLAADLEQLRHQREPTP
ncbi:winged helix-turn-helix domain-containing protein [Rhabdothermincola sp.]|uniref:winged helix-turn-helix domain-containing protein n=1 Tax=Rhabdothermincola sp. TaxID=2820405 RepID=UPI002FE19E56